MLKFAVVGCGNIAIKSSIPALINSEYCEITICIDRNIEKKSLIFDEFGLPFETSLEDALKNYSFDAVYISTPIGSHKDLALLAARNQKHILCEKSLASNISEVEEIISVCKNNNVALFEGFMYQFHTNHKFVQTLIKSGEIGDLIHFQASFGFPPINNKDFRYSKKNGGGALLDAGSYTVHAARHLFNIEPIQSYSVFENEGYEVEIRGSVLLNFGQSKTANLVFGFNNMYQNKYIIWGTKGVIYLDRAFAVPPTFKSSCILEKQDFKKEYILEPSNHFEEELKYFVKNFNKKDIINEWYYEAQLQSKALNNIIKSQN